MVALAGVLKRGAIAATAWGPSRLDIFGLETNNGMFHKAWNPGWSPSQTDWENLNGVFTSAPDAVSWSSNRLGIFGRGTDNHCYHKAWNSGWSPRQNDWENLCGVLTSRLSVAS